MDGWQVTHGLNCRGQYRRIGPNELYVRSRFGQAGATWFVDGLLMGAERNEAAAQAAAEAAARGMNRTHTAAMAAPAGELRRPADAA